MKNTKLLKNILKSFIFIFTTKLFMFLKIKKQKNGKHFKKH